MATADPDLARLQAAAGAAVDGLRRVTLVPGDRAGDGDAHTVPTLVLGLRGVVRIERPGGRPIDLGPGEAALLAPGARHRHAPLRPGCASFSQGFMLGRSDVELAQPGRSWWLAIPELPARTLLERACLSDCDARVRLAMVREGLAGWRGGRIGPMAAMPLPVERMWLFMRRMRLSPIRAASVLRSSGLGPTRAHLVFRAYFGETPHRLLTRHRLEYARHLLARGETVATVAIACGFRSRRHFTASFRAVNGVSPRRWRGPGQRHREGEPSGSTADGPFPAAPGSSKAGTVSSPGKSAGALRR